MLNTAGKLDESDYNQNSDVNFNGFNIDMVYTWIFAPGSELSVVWKNEIVTDKQSQRNNYVENLSSTVAEPQTNNISLKLVYYIDYQNIRRMFL